MLLELLGMFFITAIEMCRRRKRTLECHHRLDLKRIKKKGLCLTDFFGSRRRLPFGDDATQKKREDAADK